MNKVQSLEPARGNRGKLFPRSLAAGACVAAASLLNVAPAFADPIRIVTSGIVYQLVEDNETGFTFRGTGFDIGGGEVYFHPSDPCGPCTAGTSVNLSSTMTPNAVPGSATIDGHSYENVYFSGSFNFNAGSVTVPAIPVGERAFPVAPFTFTGTLAGYADSAMTSRLFSTGLTGQGTAWEGFFNDRPTNGYAGGIFRDGFQYEFAAAATPTPEPGTLLLFAPGAAWIARQWRRRRHAAA